MTFLVIGALRSCVSVVDEIADGLMTKNRDIRASLLCIGRFYFADNFLDNKIVTLPINMAARISI